MRLLAVTMLVLAAAALAAAPPSSKRPTWKAVTTFEPCELLSGSTSVPR